MGETHLLFSSSGLISQIVLLMVPEGYATGFYAQNRASGILLTGSDAKCMGLVSGCFDNTYLCACPSLTNDNKDLHSEQCSPEYQSSVCSWRPCNQALCHNKDGSTIV